MKFREFVFHRTPPPSHTLVGEARLNDVGRRHATADLPELARSVP